MSRLLSRPLSARAARTSRVPRRRFALPPALLLWLTLLLAASAGTSGAQPMRFGSADDPGEQLQRDWWKRESTLDVMGGLSLIAAQWRTSTNVSLDLVTRSLTARLGGTLRTGLYGTYRPDFDEPYDLLRLASFVRYNPPPRNLSSFHFRGGPLRRLRLGTGHLVNFYNTTAAWDDRTFGVETRCCSWLQSGSV
jgi:hypothetical protein